jgi:hypothetical protein
VSAAKEPRRPCRDGLWARARRVGRTPPLGIALHGARRLSSPRGQAPRAPCWAARGTGAPQGGCREGTALQSGGLQPAAAATPRGHARRVGHTPPLGIALHALAGPLSLPRGQAPRAPRGGCAAWPRRIGHTPPQGVALDGLAGPLPFRGQAPSGSPAGHVAAGVLGGWAAPRPWAAQGAPAWTGSPGLFSSEGAIPFRLGASRSGFPFGRRGCLRMTERERARGEPYRP